MRETDSTPLGQAASEAQPGPDTKEAPGALGEKLAQDVCKSQPIGCGRPRAEGRPVFITHPNVDPQSRPDCYTKGLKGYQRSFQHPLYQTSSAVYGRHCPPPGLNKTHFPRNANFTNHLSKCGNYQDIHFTTEIVSDFVYKPVFDPSL